VKANASSIDDECRRLASPFKEREEPSRVFFVLIFCGDVFNYHLLLLPRQLDGAMSPIIVLATVVSLYIPFALSFDRRYFHVIF
jgi:hypothetical protein